MSFLADLFGGGGIGTIFSGISGLIGGYLTKRENRLMMETNHAHELAMADVDSRNAKFELQASITIAKNKLEIAEAEGEIERDIIATQSNADIERLAAETFKNGTIEAQKPTGYPGVDKFRALTRPLITWFLFLFVVVIFGFLQYKVGSLVAADTALLVKIYVYLIQSTIYLFIMAVSWWFMSRGERSVAAIKGLFSK